MKLKASNIIWGLAFILVGVLFIGKTFWSWNFSVWSIFWNWWPLFIIIPSIAGIFDKGLRTSSLVGCLIGCVLLLWTNDLLDISSIQKIIVPAVLILIGICILFKGVFSQSKISKEAYDKYNNSNAYNNASTYNNSNFNNASNGFNNQTNDNSSAGQNFNNTSNSQGSANNFAKDGVAEYSAIFSANKVIYPNTVFNGACINSVFGSVVLDLRDAIIDSDVVINSTCIFAGADVLVPNNCNIKISSVPIFGGVSNKTKQIVNANSPTIFINATCMFGGMDIK